MFNLLTKVYQPTRGTILLDGKDTHGMNTVQVNKAGIARTFQNIRLFTDLTVEENVKVGLHNNMKGNMISEILRLPGYWKSEKMAHERAMELLSIFDMRDLKDHKGRLSALRRSAPAGDRPGAGNQSVPAAAGRACCRYEPLRDCRADGKHPEDPGYLPYCDHAH